MKEKFKFFSLQDSDVAEEKRKVNGMSSFSDSDAVIVRNLVKVCTRICFTCHFGMYKKWNWLKKFMHVGMDV